MQAPEEDVAGGQSMQGQAHRLKADHPPAFQLDTLYASL